MLPRRRRLLPRVGCRRHKSVAGLRGRLLVLDLRVVLAASWRRRRRHELRVGREALLLLRLRSAVVERVVLLVLRLVVVKLRRGKAVVRRSVERRRGGRRSGESVRGGSGRVGGGAGGGGSTRVVGELAAERGREFFRQCGVLRFVEGE